MNEQKQKLLILALIAVLTILPLLGLTDYNTKGEPRESIVAYSMLESGNWILPRNYGGDIAFKPPFFHWSIAAVSALGGGMTEGTSRLPSALALIGMMLAVYWFYARRKGVWQGFLAACITLTCFEVHRAGFACRVDMVLTAFIVLALLQFYLWFEKGKKGMPWLAILFMGCATLTKGPVGIILPCLVTGVFLWIKEGHFWKLVLKFTGIFILACILPAIWYGLAYQQGGSEFFQLMMEENFGRFLGKMSYGSHENPVHYNVVMLIAGYLPWSLLLLFSLFSLRYTKPSGNVVDWWKRLVALVKNSNSLHLFSFLSIALIFIFYCIPASKRSVYLLPIYPFIGYFLAIYFIWLLRHGKRAIKAFAVLLTFLAVLLTLVFLVVRAGWIPDTFFSGRHAAENIQLLHALEEVPLHVVNLILVVMPLCALVYLWRKMREKQLQVQSIFALCITVFALFLALDGVYQPAVLGAKSDKQFALEIQELVPQGKIYTFGPHYYSINYYNHNRLALFEKELPEQGVLLAGKKYQEQLMSQFGDQYLFSKIGESPRRSCDTRDFIYIFRFVRKENVNL